MTMIDDPNERKDPYILRANYAYVNRHGLIGRPGTVAFHRAQRRAEAGRKASNQLRQRASTSGGTWLVQHEWQQKRANRCKPIREQQIVNIGTPNHPYEIKVLGPNVIQPTVKSRKGKYRYVIPGTNEVLELSGGTTVYYEAERRVGTRARKQARRVLRRQSKRQHGNA
jgi:hypothetical protein